jgi:hypothetical protein
MIDYHRFFKKEGFFNMMFLIGMSKINPMTEDEINEFIVKNAQKSFKFITKYSLVV